MAPADTLSPAGSSTYSSNTLYVGDGTWDATRNDFLLPNLMGLNFETMRYNGMGNRFRDFNGYYGLIVGHAVLAVIVFLFIVPAAILIAQFYRRNPRWGLRMHIYLQIFTVLLTTVIFILGNFAVGPARALTNPHHGIGLAIYVLVLFQAFWGWLMHNRERRKGAPRRLPLKIYIHQWLGRTLALLGFAQVPLGLTLYGSPKWTFVLYALWMFFLLCLFFILSFRARPVIGDGLGRSTSYGGSVISEKKSGRMGGLLGPLAIGAGAAALLGRNRSRSRARREEVISSRRGSGSYVDEEKYETRRKESGGFTDKLLKGAALVGAAGLAKSWYDRRQRRKDEDDYSSVANDTPSRKTRPGRPVDSEISEDTASISRVERDRRRGPILPGPGDPLAAAAAMSAADSRPMTPRPVRRTDSYDSDDYSYYDSTLSPSRRTEKSHGERNGFLAGLGLGWFGKKIKDRKDRKELERQDRLEAERVLQERQARQGNTPARFTGDKVPPRRYDRRGSKSLSSDLSSMIDDPHSVRPGSIPAVPSALASTVATGLPAGVAAGSAINQSRSRNDVTERVSMPLIPPDPQGILHEESGSETYDSPGGHPHRRHSQIRRREGEAAAAAAIAGAASLAAEEEARRQRSRSRATEGPPPSRTGIPSVASPPVSVKMQIHNDKDRRVTLRRLTEQEAAAEREAKRSERRRRRDSLSSLSGTETGASRRRFRRDERGTASGGESSVAPPPPVMEPLSPPNPSFAGGRRPKDSAYYSGRPAEGGGSGQALGGALGVDPMGGGTSIASRESHGTWSAMSPTVSGVDPVDPAERRRRRRLERNQRGQSGTVDFS